MHPSEWSSASWNMTKLIALMMQHNGAPLFDFSVVVDDRNVSRYIVSILPPRYSGILPMFRTPLATVNVSPK